MNRAARVRAIAEAARRRDALRISERLRSNVPHYLDEEHRTDSLFEFDFDPVDSGHPWRTSDSHTVRKRNAARDRRSNRWKP